MKIKAINAIIGDPDVGFGTGGVTKTNGEYQYVIKKNGVNFVALGFDGYPDLCPKKNYTLKSVWIVYDDRRAEEIKLDGLR
jgi:hypothetical protein